MAAPELKKLIFGKLSLVKLKPFSTKYLICSSFVDFKKAFDKVNTTIIEVFTRVTQASLLFLEILLLNIHSL